MRLFILLLLLFRPALSHAQSVADWFVRLPDTYFITGTPLFDLTRAKREQLVAGKNLPDFTMLILDRKNSFLRCRSGGDGESVLYEMTYWKQADGNLLIGLVIQSMDELSVDTGQIYFLQTDGTEVADVTSRYLPKLTVRDFFSASFDRVRLRNKQADGPLGLYWQLPQRGTSIRIDLTKFEPGAEADLAKAALARKSVYRFELQWSGKGFKTVRLAKPR